MDCTGTQLGRHAEQDKELASKVHTLPKNHPG